MSCRRLILIIILIIGIFPVAAGEIPSSHFPTKAEIQQRTVSKSHIEKYLKDRNFDYGESYEMPEESAFLARFMNKILSFLSRFFRVINQIPWIFQLFLLGAALLMVFIIAKKTRLYKMFYRDVPVQKMEFQEIDLTSGEFDFDAEIAKEFSRKKFRNAIRLLHLKILKTLGSKNIIRLAKDKTNRDYLREIPDTDMRKNFIDLTGIYNKIWYGHHPISEEEYIRYALDFNHFTQTVYATKE